MEHAAVEQLGTGWRGGFDHVTIDIQALGKRKSRVPQAHDDKTDRGRAHNLRQLNR